MKINKIFIPVSSIADATTGMNILLIFIMIVI